MQFENAANTGRECPFESEDEHRVWVTVEEKEGASPVYQVEVFSEIPAPEWVRMMRNPALAAELFSEVLDRTTGAIVGFQKHYRPTKTTYSHSNDRGWERELES